MSQCIGRIAATESGWSAGRLLGTLLRYRRTDSTSYPDMERQMGAVEKNRKEKKHNSRVSLYNLPIFIDLIKDIFVFLYHANSVQK